MDKTLTIIIPTYNMERYLRHCLDSLVVPNMDEVEVLVINDGSKDSSSAIAHEYQDKFPQTFRVIDKENGNYGSCINRGLKGATGKYVKVLDADDSFDNNSFGLFIECAKAIDVDLIITDYITVNEKDETTGFYDYNALFKMQDKSSFSFKDFVALASRCTLPMHCIAYNRRVFKDLNYYQIEGISYTDNQWAIEPMVNVNTVYYLHLALYKYFVGRPGQTMDPRVYTKSLPHRLKVFERLVFVWEQHGQKTASLNQYLSNIIQATYLRMFASALFHKSNEQSTMLSAFDRRLKQAHRSFYNYSNGFSLSPKLKIPYLWYWRHFHTFRPFKILFKIKFRGFNLSEL